MSGSGAHPLFAHLVVGSRACSTCGTRIRSRGTPVGWRTIHTETNLEHEGPVHRSYYACDDLCYEALLADLDTPQGSLQRGTPPRSP